MRHFDVVVAGGGAAGLMAAGAAASGGRRVLLCEKMEKPARKVRITGKGRCNLTNMRPEAEFLDKVRASADFFRPAFEHFSNRETVRFFESLGVPLVTERGERVFPASGKAWDIADALVTWCRNLGVIIECHTRVTGIDTRHGRVCGLTTESSRPETERPSVRSEQKDTTIHREKISTENLILATGGLSYPATGSTGEGYDMAHLQGHRIEPVRPSLVPLESDLQRRYPLEGLALRNVSACLLLDGHRAMEEFGEMEFTRFGVTGPVILKISRRAVDALIDGRKVELSLNLKPALGTAVLTERIEREAVALRSEATVRDLLKPLLPGKLVSPVVAETSRRAGANLDKVAVKRLTRGEKELIAAVLQDFRFGITDYRPFEEAVVTAGGVATGEVNPETLESKLVRGLYFAGELLDIDADTGGYNLQIAFSTGHLAGQLRTEGGNKGTNHDNVASVVRL